MGFLVGGLGDAGVLNDPVIQVRGTALGESGQVEIGQTLQFEAAFRFSPAGVPEVRQKCKRTLQLVSYLVSE